MSIKIYSTSSCPWCNVAKDFLRKHKIKFEDINVGENKKAAQEMIKKSGQMGVPVIDVDGTIIVGFNEQALKKALNIK